MRNWRKGGRERIKARWMGEGVGMRRARRGSVRAGEMNGRSECSVSTNREMKEDGKNGEGVEEGERNEK